MTPEEHIRRLRESNAEFKWWLVVNEYVDRIPTLNSISDNPGILAHLNRE